MSSAGTTYVAVGREVGLWPDRREARGDGAAVQVGFDVVALPRVELVQLWQAARWWVRDGAVGVGLGELIAAVRERRVRGGVGASAPLVFPRLAGLGDGELSELVRWLVQRGLLVAVSSDEGERAGLLSRLRLFAGADASADHDPDAEGRIRLSNGRWLDPGLFELWSWCSAHGSLEQTRQLVYPGVSAGVMLGLAARLCAEAGAFVDRADAGRDRSVGAGLGALVDVPSGTPLSWLDEPRWFGLRARRTTPHTFALGQLLRRTTVDRRHEYLVRLGKGRAQFGEAAYWSWSRAFGRQGNLGLWPLAEYVEMALGVEGGPEAVHWLAQQPLLLQIGGTDEELVRAASMVKIAPRTRVRDSTGLGFELAVFGHLEPSLWASVQAVAAQRAAEGRDDFEGGTDPIEILRAFLLHPDQAIRLAGYLDLA